MADDVLEGRLDDVYVPLELLDPVELTLKVRFPVRVDDPENVVVVVVLNVPLILREVVLVDCREAADIPLLVIETLPVEVKDRAEVSVIVLLEVDVLLDVLLGVNVTVFMGVFVLILDNVDVIVDFTVYDGNAVEVIVFVDIDERDKVGEADDVFVLETDPVSVEEAVEVLVERIDDVVVGVKPFVFVPFEVLLRVGLEVVVLDGAAERVKEGDEEAVRVDPIVLVPDGVAEVVLEVVVLEVDVLLEVAVLDEDVDAERVFVVTALIVIRGEALDVFVESAEFVPFRVDRIVILGKELGLILLDGYDVRVEVVVFVEVLDCVDVVVGAITLFTKYL